MEINNKELGQRIKYLRQINGLTQSKFGEKINAYKTEVCKWEKGHGKPGVERLNAIANAYNVDLKWLLFGVGDENE